MRLAHRLARVALVGALLAGVGLAAYALSSALGQEPPIGQPGDPAAVATLTADSAKPKFTGLLAGLRLTAGGADVGSETGCAELSRQVPFELTKGTAFEIEPTYLPAGLGGESGQPSASACEGTLVGSGRGWAPSKPGGPWIWIQRVLRPEPWSYSYAPAERVTSGFISTKAVSNLPAVLVRPVLPDGRGGSYIIFAEKMEAGFVVTIINGEGVPLADLTKVAEGLSR